MAHDDRFGQQLGNVGIALEPGEGLIDQAPSSSRYSGCTISIPPGDGRTSP